jgi:cation transporter-like permease
MSNSRKPRSSALRPCCDQNVVSLAVYRAKRRRAAIAAQAAARRRTVICLMLCLLGLVAGVVAREREGQMQMVEVARG